MNVRKDTRYDYDAARAAQTLRWLEQSGPRYRDTRYIFRGIGLEGDDGWYAWLLFPDTEQEVTVRQEQMSFASWGICIEAKSGQFITLKVRIDPVALASLGT